ncbi:hypothetical protein HPB50_024261 [Hyalomma asiaticum]|uniref:Uncharacterized protein n=1 Tax=Hyalomma asiaticum TaxID=266040 RepID=A0ACB7SC91_HYAAI|nr:hypothetical protein HPB50_024261 [Hyalomma asiaticum]
MQRLTLKARCHRLRPFINIGCSTSVEECPMSAVTLCFGDLPSVSLAASESSVMDYRTGLSQALEAVGKHCVTAPAKQAASEASTSLPHAAPEQALFPFDLSTRSPGRHANRQ